MRFHDSIMYEILLENKSCVKGTEVAKEVPQIYQSKKMAFKKLGIVERYQCKREALSTPKLR